MGHRYPTYLWRFSWIGLLVSFQRAPGRRKEESTKVQASHRLLTPLFFYKFPVTTQFIRKHAPSPIDKIINRIMKSKEPECPFLLLQGPLSDFYLVYLTKQVMDCQIFAVYSCCFTAQILNMPINFIGLKIKRIGGTMFALNFNERRRSAYEKNKFLLLVAGLMASIFVMTGVPQTETDS